MEFSPKNREGEDRAFCRVHRRQTAVNQGWRMVGLQLDEDVGSFPTGHVTSGGQTWPN